MLLQYSSHIRTSTTLDLISLAFDPIATATNLPFTPAQLSSPSPPDGRICASESTVCVSSCVFCAGGLSVACPPPAMSSSSAAVTLRAHHQAPDQADRQEARARAPFARCRPVGGLRIPERAPDVDSDLGAPPTCGSLHPGYRRLRRPNRLYTPATERGRNHSPGRLLQPDSHPGREKLLYNRPRMPSRVLGLISHPPLPRGKRIPDPDQGVQRMSRIRLRSVNRGILLAETPHSRYSFREEPEHEMSFSGLSIFFFLH